jgi:hypothetical protein
LKAGAITSASPQISLSKPLPSASNTPTTFQSFFCIRIESPMLACCMRWFNLRPTMIS